MIFCQIFPFQCLTKFNGIVVPWQMNIYPGKRKNVFKLCSRYNIKQSMFITMRQRVVK